MGRPPCCDKANVKRGLWTAEEDAKILAYVSTHGIGNWTLVPKKAGLNRCGKSCRLRWTNYLRPDLKHSEFTPQEEQLIIDLHKAIGSRWSFIAKQLPGRTDNDVKNHWNTKLKKRLVKMEIDPVTHKPFSQIFSDYKNISGAQTNPSPHTVHRSMQFPQLPSVASVSDSESCSSILSGLTSIDIPRFPFLNQQSPYSDFNFLPTNTLHLFDQVSPSCPSTLSSPSSVTSTQSFSSNHLLFPWDGTNKLPPDPSSESNRQQARDCFIQSTYRSNQEQSDTLQSQWIQHEGHYKTRSPVSTGGTGSQLDGNDTVVTEVGTSNCNESLQSSVNSFLTTILDRDSQMQMDFPVFDDILDY